MSFIKSVSRVTFAQDQFDEEAGWDLVEDNLFHKKGEHEPEKRTTITFLGVECGRR